MNRNSKIFLGLAIFLFCCAFSLQFSFEDDGASFQLTFASMIPLMLGFISAAVAMMMIRKKAKQEESFDGDELELKELNEIVVGDFEGEEFV